MLHVPYGWLLEYLDTAASAAEIAETLTRIGLEVEAIRNPDPELAPFRVVRIEDAMPHPQADRLRQCVVDTGTERLQIVCGAPNARTGLRTILAPIGAVMPSGGTQAGMCIREAAVRGVASHGMLCSAAELGLAHLYAKDAEGIVELPDDTPVGMSLHAVLGWDTPVLIVSVTPNRGDALSIWGIARDLAAAGVGVLREPPLLPVDAIREVPECTQAIDPSLVSVAHFCRIEGLRTDRPVHSPLWLQTRLRSVGMRPITLLVDLTYYALMAWGQPMHVYDAHAVRGALSIRPASEGEVFDGLDGASYTLPSGTPVVADVDGPVAVLGVLGGARTACKPDSNAVILEAVCADPVAVRCAGQKLGIVTESRARMERGIDPAACGVVMRRIAAWIQQWCGGAIAAVTAYDAVPAPASIRWTPDAYTRSTGVTMPDDRMRGYLTAIGCRINLVDDGVMEVFPPSWRHDVTHPADLVEELLRLEGLHSVPAVPLAHQSVTLSADPVRSLRRMLAGRGLHEVVTWSFVSEQDVVRLGLTVDPALRIVNPITEDLSVMRPSALPHMMAAAVRNQSHRMGDLHAYEVGPRFINGTPSGTRQHVVVVRAGIMQPGQEYAGAYQQSERTVDAFDAKADAEAICALLGIAVRTATTDLPPWLHPGQALRYETQERDGTWTTLGYAGRLHPAYTETLACAVPVVVCMLDLIPAYYETVPLRHSTAECNYASSVARDFAFLIPDGVAIGPMLDGMAAVHSDIIHVRLFDVFNGTGVPEGMQSIALTVTFVPPAGHTYTGAELQDRAERVVQYATHSWNAVLRDGTGGT